MKEEDIQTAEATLKNYLITLRERLEAAFGADTASPLCAESQCPSNGQCVPCALIVWRILGGGLVSARIDGASHWFNRIWVDLDGAQGDAQARITGLVLEADITGDQFGRSAVQVSSSPLYDETVERPPSDVEPEAWERAAILATRAGLPHIARSMRIEAGTNLKTLGWLAVRASILPTLTCAGGVALGWLLWGG